MGGCRTFPPSAQRLDREPHRRTTSSDECPTVERWNRRRELPEKVGAVETLHPTTHLRRKLSERAPEVAVLIVHHGDMMPRINR